MSGYRQMRRHARQARRAGMQPMMVINSGDPFPELAIVVIARWAWRYRSELAPLAAVAAALAGAGLVGARRAARWRPAVLAAALAAAAAAGRVRREARPARPAGAALRRRGDARGRGVAGAGRRARPARRAAAARPGHRRAGAVGAVVGAPPPARQGPRGTDPRRLAGHRPNAVGLAGSAVMSATVDLWGWRARFRLARGQTITDVIAEDSRDRVGAWHLPGRGARLPDPR